MSYQAFTGLIGNASLLLALGLMYDFVSDKGIFKGKRSEERRVGKECI